MSNVFNSRNRSTRNLVIYGITFVLLSASSALLLAASVSSPTSSDVRVTRIESAGTDAAGYYADMGILGACTNIPTYTSSYWNGGDCRTTQVGYRMNLLLPYKANATDTDAEIAPYPLARPYWIVDEGNADKLVIVPIATGFSLLGLMLYIPSSVLQVQWLHWVTMLPVVIGAVLAWASFGVTYTFTDTVQANLEAYNADDLAVMAPLVAHRGIAVWLLAAAATLGTIALLGVLMSHHHEKQQLSRASWAHTTARKHSREGEMGSV